MSNSSSILITVPKYVTIPTSSHSPSSICSGSGSDNSMDEFIMRGKKRRLDHLTWEEKIQRK